MTPSSAVCSSTRTRRPCLPSASAAANPPSPPPAIRIASSDIPHSDALDLPLELDAALLFHTPTHCLAECFNVGGRRAAEIDEKIAVQLRHLRLADAQATAARFIDQLPRALPGRVLERRASGAVARLARLALLLDVVHLRGDRLRIPGTALKHGR